MKYFKINNIKACLALAIIAMVGFTSCLKKTGLNTDPDTGTGSNNVVEIQNSGRQVSYTSVYPQYDNSLSLTGDTSGFFVNIDYAGATATAPQDITVSLALNSAALTTFNTSSSTSYTIPDSSVYSFPKTATITKGNSLVQVRVTIKSSTKYDFSASYALPLAVTSTSYGVLSSNYNIAIFSFAVRNKYDGVYAAQAGSTLVDLVSPTITEYTTPFKTQLRTFGANSVAMWDIVYANTYGHVILSGTSTSYYGTFSPVFNIDPTTGAVISVVNYYGQPASNTRSAVLDPSGVNKYDATTKTLKVSYWMDQSSAITGHRAHFVETFVYSGAR